MQCTRFALTGNCESLAAFRTWEWASDAQIRGYAHPGLFALFYKLLALLVRFC